jgi:hypothetical protein
MTTIPYPEILNYLSSYGIHIPAFENCIGVDDQFIAIYGLAYMHTEEIIGALKKQKEFVSLWNQASSRDKKIFVSTIVAAAHSLPGVATWAAKVNCQNIRSLSELRNAYIDKVDKEDEDDIASRHARNTSALYALLLP